MNVHNKFCQLRQKNAFASQNNNILKGRWFRSQRKAIIKVAKELNIEVKDKSFLFWNKLEFKGGTFLSRKYIYNVARLMSFSLRKDFNFNNFEEFRNIESHMNKSVKDYIRDYNTVCDIPADIYLKGLLSSKKESIYSMRMKIKDDNNRSRN